MSLELLRSLVDTVLATFDYAVKLIETRAIVNFLTSALTGTKDKIEQQILHVAITKETVNEVSPLHPLPAGNSSSSQQIPFSTILEHSQSLPQDDIVYSLSFTRFYFIILQFLVFIRKLPQRTSSSQYHCSFKTLSHSGIQ